MKKIKLRPLVRSIWVEISTEVWLFIGQLLLLAVIYFFLAVINIGQIDFNLFEFNRSVLISMCLISSMAVLGAYHHHPEDILAVLDRLLWSLIAVGIVWYGGRYLLPIILGN